jgi:hypothetical protein
MLPIYTIAGPYLDHGGYMSAEHIPHDLNIMVMVH